MKKYICLLAIGLLTIGLTSCKEDDKVTVVPSDIQNLRADTQNKPGFIVLRWDTPDDNTIRYIKVMYFDPLLNVNSLRVASVYADSILIPETRNKFGEYEFKVQTISESGDGGVVQAIKATSEPAPVRVVYGDSKRIELTADQLSTNAQEESEGPIADLIDGDNNTYFHSDWQGNPTTDGNDKHWFQIDVRKQLTYFKYESVARNGNNIPNDVDIMGSNDGVTFELIQNLTQTKNGMPMSTTPFTSPVMGKNIKPYRYIRYVVNKTNSGSVFFSMAEFKLFEVSASVIDPEKD